ncbi:MAG: hypothetical protein U0704_06910 [Candidatus Eisenbacteria bacterium]
MSATFSFPPGLPAVLVALACLIGGAAWFADALRAVRFRRAWFGLRERPLAAGEGVARVRGQVALTGPLFSPLGHRPCAGFVLEAHGVAGAHERMRGCVHERRPFELRDGDETAVVAPGHADWTLPVTHERTFAPGEALGANLEALLDRHPELAWLRRRGGALRVVERALHHGDRVTVLGMVERTDALAPEASLEWLRTGTDGAPVAVETAAAHAAGWTLVAPEGFALQLHATGAPEARVRVPSFARTWGALLGPLLSLAGLLALARLAGSVWGGR